MDKLIEFVSNNYAWFLTISIILLFALIGYIYDNRNNFKGSNGESKKEIIDKEEIKEEVKENLEEEKVDPVEVTTVKEEDKVDNLLDE